MKLKALILLVTGFFVLIPFSLFPQYLGMGFKMEDIRSIVLDGYENNDNGWQVSASRFATEGFPKLKMGVEGAPIALMGAYAEGENRYVMGVRASFTRNNCNPIF